MTMAATREEISRIREALAGLSLPEDSEVRTRVERLLNELEEGPAAAWEVTISSSGRGTSRGKLRLPRGGETTLRELRALVDQEGSASIVSGHAQAPDSASLCSLGISNGSHIVLESRSSETSRDGLREMSRGAFEHLALSFHRRCLDRGFICTGTGAESSSVRGFAAPARDISAEEFVPTGWNAHSMVAMFRYRRNDVPGKAHQLKIAEMDGKAMVTFGTQGGDIETDEVEIQEPRWDSARLSDAVNQLEASVLVPFIPIRAKKRSGEDTLMEGNSQQPPRPLPESPCFVSDEDHLRVGPPRFPFPGVIPAGGPGRYGGDFSGDLLPGGISGGFDPRSGPPGSGGLMGPDHPMFSGSPDQHLYAEPRFDPFMPPGAVNPNLGRGGRGRGRGGRPQGYGPNPDHLPPPGGNMFM